MPLDVRRFLQKREHSYENTSVKAEAEASISLNTKCDVSEVSGHREISLLISTKPEPRRKSLLLSSLPR